MWAAGNLQGGHSDMCFYLVSILPSPEVGMGSMNCHADGCMYACIQPLSTGYISMQLYTKVARNSKNLGRVQMFGFDA